MNWNPRLLKAASAELPFAQLLRVSRRGKLLSSLSLGDLQPEDGAQKAAFPSWHSPVEQNLPCYVAFSCLETLV